MLILWQTLGDWFLKVSYHSGCLKGDLHGTTVACDKLATDPRHKLFCVNETYNSLMTVVYVTKKCRRILKHVSKSYDNHRYRQC